MALTDAAQIFQALSHESRLRILKALQIRSLCVCEMRAMLDVATPTVSNHLSILRNAGLIEDEKDGRFVSYRLVDEPRAGLITAMLRLLEEWPQEPSDPVLVDDARLLSEVSVETLCGR